jgi:hypothetical protein
LSHAAGERHGDKGRKICLTSIKNCFKAMAIFLHQRSAILKFPTGKRIETYFRQIIAIENIYPHQKSAAYFFIATFWG